MGIRSGFSSRCRTLLRAKRWSLIYWMSTSRTVCTGWGWRLSYTVKRNHKRRTWAGTGEVITSITMKMDTVAALLSISRIIHWLGIILFPMTMMRYILHTLIPTLIAIWSHISPKLRLTHIWGPFAKGHLCARLSLEIMFSYLPLLKNILSKKLRKAILLSLPVFIQDRVSVPMSVMVYWNSSSQLTKRQKSCANTLYSKLSPWSIPMVSSMETTAQISAAMISTRNGKTLPRAFILKSITSKNSSPIYYKTVIFICIVTCMVTLWKKMPSFTVLMTKWIPEKERNSPF